MKLPSCPINPYLAYSYPFFRDMPYAANWPTYDVDLGIGTREDMEWFTNLFNDETYYRYYFDTVQRLLKEGSYTSSDEVWDKAVQEVTKAGYFHETNHGSHDFHKSITKFMDHQINNNFETIARNKSIVLYMPGAFCPIHNGHVEAMRKARDAMIAQGYDVLGCFFLPAHDEYVLEKTKQSNIFGVDRNRMIELAVKDEPDFHLCDMISTYSACDKNFTLFLETFSIVFMNNTVIRHKSGIEHLKIKTCLVVGDDNKDFIKPFGNPGDQDSDNIAYVVPRDHISSSAVRAGSDEMLHPDVKAYWDFKQNGGRKKVYQIRFNPVDISHNMMEVVKDVFRKYIPDDVEITTLNTNNQFSLYGSLVENLHHIHNLVSLDKHHYHSNTFNVTVSRLFDDNQAASKTILIDDEVFKIAVEEMSSRRHLPIILVDDDVATGGTIQAVKSRFEQEGFTVSDDYILLNTLTIGNDEVYDVVDWSDFTALGDGLMMLDEKTGSPVRVSYMDPRVDLTHRAKIPVDKVDEFRKDLARTLLNFKEGGGLTANDFARFNVPFMQEILKT